MIILTIRTDKPEVEIGVYEDDKQLAYEIWQAHRQLAETLHQQIAKSLDALAMEWKDIGGVVAYKGPGSFTGLRIGLSVANALAHGQNIPIVSTGGENWLKDGIRKLSQKINEQTALPDYGAPVRTTLPRK